MPKANVTVSAPINSAVRKFLMENPVWLSMWHTHYLYRFLMRHREVITWFGSVEGFTDAYEEIEADRKVRLDRLLDKYHKGLLTEVGYDKEVEWVNFGHDWELDDLIVKTLKEANNG